MNQTLITILIIVVLVCIAIHFYRKFFKALVIPNVFLVTGAVKSGKSLLSVHLAIKMYKRELRHYKIAKFFLCTILHVKKPQDLEEPMLYSNIPLAKVKYNLLTIDIVIGKVRIPSKSVVLIDEASLLADSMLFKNPKINNALLKFVKLFGHMSHGGFLIIDTQSLSDCHFAFKRCVNQYLYIYKRIKLPFITIMQVREMMYSDDGSVVNNYDEDIELSMRNVLIFNSTYKKYDCYTYSCFFDYLPTQVKYDVQKKSKFDDLKSYQIVTFQDFAKSLNENLKEIYDFHNTDYEYIYENEEEENPQEEIPSDNDDEEPKVIFEEEEKK